MITNKITSTKSPVSPEPICDQCKRPAPVIIEGTTGRTCAACDQALKVAKLVDELSDTYDFYETQLSRDAAN